jgi:uncharacterized membrane protein
MFLKLLRNFLERLFRIELRLPREFLLVFVYTFLDFLVIVGIRIIVDPTSNESSSRFKALKRVETRDLCSKSVDLTINLPLHNLLNSFHINPFTAMSDVCRK